MSTIRSSPASSPRNNARAQPAADAGRFDTFLDEVRRCTVCAPHLPLGPRPIIHALPTARLLIASQAPGTKAHLAGRSFADASGDRLRDWLDLPEDVFYDPRRVAIVPMGLCYPGRHPQGGDRPPRPECAPLWRERILSHLPHLELTLLIGSYAQAYVLGPGRVIDRVQHFRETLPHFLPLPHPSWRTTAWEKRAPWFHDDVIPALRERVAAILNGPPPTET